MPTNKKSRKGVVIDKWDRSTTKDAFERTCSATLADKNVSVSGFSNKNYGESKGRSLRREWKASKLEDLLAVDVPITDARFVSALSAHLNKKFKGKRGEK